MFQQWTRMRRNDNNWSELFRRSFEVLPWTSPSSKKFSANCKYDHVRNQGDAVHMPDQSGSKEFCWRMRLWGSAEGSWWHVAEPDLPRKTRARHHAIPPATKNSWGSPTWAQPVRRWQAAWSSLPMSSGPADLAHERRQKGRYRRIAEIAELHWLGNCKHIAAAVAAPTALQAAALLICWAKRKALMPACSWQ